MSEKPYRPSNGTEGLMFMERWCQRCEKDRAFRESIDERGVPASEGCPILSASMLYEPGEEGYPKEWVYDPDAMLRDGALTIGEGGARCTAFEPSVGGEGRA